MYFSIISRKGEHSDENCTYITVHVKRLGIVCDVLDPHWFHVGISV